MKKLILILVTSLTFAQKGTEHYIYFSGAVDVLNLAVGSKPTEYKSGLDYFLQFGMVARNFEINIGYERFGMVQFSKNTIGLGYHFPLYSHIGNKDIKVVFIPSIEPTIINRWGTWGDGLSYDQASSHLSVAGNLSLRAHLSDSFAVEYLFNALPRVDIYGKYDNNNWSGRTSINDVPIVGSNYLKLIYKIDH
ncbi:hypothetical protein [Flavobacterium lacustre]|uniref:hypothetical protein n=1 Tax=Flavobacterium lacustre TaxID=3016339 RepID=UPI0022B6F75C|nr:hypothetical protein [Flavobacterium lacustre]